MASLIPKIKVGLAANKREKHNLSFDCSTTANLGYVQPTMCREMSPKSKYKVKVSTLVRLASMPVPTFGRMSLRHYHSFVPCVDLWQPFDAMMSGQHYQGINTANFIPTKVPFFTFPTIAKLILDYADVSIAPNEDIDNPYTITTTNVDWTGKVYSVGNGEGEYPTMLAAIQAAQAADLARVQAAWTALKNQSWFDGALPSRSLHTHHDTHGNGRLLLGDFYSTASASVSTLTLHSNTFIDNSGSTVITSEGADFSTVAGPTNSKYVVHFKLPAALKRLRSIFIGLGYSFSPYNTDEMSVLKLLGYYKSWFNLFNPKRERSFVDTPCYTIIKNISGQNGINVGTHSTTADSFVSLLEELAWDCRYYFPQDYFCMSVLTPYNNNQDTSFTMNTGAAGKADGTEVSTDGVVVKAQQNMGSAGNGPTITPATASTGLNNPMAIRMALRLLSWTNKNTVIGRSIREYLKVHFGVSDVNAIDDGGVYRIGASRTNITISDVMSTAETNDAYLGDYAGKGIGYGDSEQFDFTADKFGYWITLTAVVPESGYYQGYMKENRHLNRYQFFNPEFDAMGYQVLERGEVMDDYTRDSAQWKPATSYKRTYAFGFVPRYSEYKVGRNIVNGDLSLRGLSNSMAPYTLDRRFPDAEPVSTGTYVDPKTGQMKAKYTFNVPASQITVIGDNFRMLNENSGNYNRIFNYTPNDLDHFIIHNIFDVVGYLPMKSLSESFDTVAADDEGSIEVAHS